MKFNIGNVKSYGGEDLIFLVGCPGSRWSEVFLTLADNPAINTSEWRDHNKWDMPVETVQGDIIDAGKHRGVYWGPGQEFGGKFDKLLALSKTELLTEFMEPFDNWDKIKVIKSHAFAYNMDYVYNLFPKAKFIACYANDIDSFYWWHKCGGWGILFPSYSWYNNDSNMLSKIKEENYNILRFNKDKGILFNLLSTSEFYSKLGIDCSVDQDPILKCEVAIYDGTFMPNFGHIIR
jgi:hypothetical protein